MLAGSYILGTISKFQTERQRRPEVFNIGGPGTQYVVMVTKLF